MWKAGEGKPWGISLQVGSPWLHGKPEIFRELFLTRRSEGGLYKCGSIRHPFCCGYHNGRQELPPASLRCAFLPPHVCSSPPSTAGKVETLPLPLNYFYFIFFGVPIKADSFNHPSFKRETGERQGESAVNLETHLTPPC